MQINSVQSSSVSYQASASNSFAKVKQDFEDLGSALDSGNLTDAKKAYSQLLKDAPSLADENNPVSDTIETLGKALDSGDLKSAQESYAKIEKALSQKPPAGGQGGQSGGARGGSRAGGGSQSSTTYDVKDTDQDGVVSAQEQYEYDLTHPTEAAKDLLAAQSSDSTAIGTDGESIDINA